MFKGIEKSIQRLIGCAVGLLLLGLVCCASVYSLSGMARAGIDTILGQLLGKTVEVAVTEGIPGLGRIVGPSVEVVQTEVTTRVKGLRPTGTTELFGGAVTIDFSRFGAAGETTITTYGPSGVRTTTGTEGAPEPPTGCTQVNTSYSRQALDAWKEGKVEDALAFLDMTDASDCLAVHGLVPIFAPAQRALEAMHNLDPEQGASTRTVRAAALAMRDLNPLYMASYSSARWAALADWLEAGGDTSQAKEILGGAKITVVGFDNTKYYNGIRHDDGDTFKIAIDFGNGWATTYILRRDYLKDLGNALVAEDALLKVDGSTSIKTTKGDALTSNGWVLRVVGAIYPASLPDVSAPAEDAFQPVTISSPPVGVDEEVPPEDEEKGAVDDTSTVTLTYKRSYGTLYGWVTRTLGVSWEEFTTLNSDWETGYEDAALTEIDYTFPKGTTE